MIPSDPQGPAAWRKGSVLLVDDEQPLLDMYSAALSATFDVSTAANAQEADRLLESKSFKVVVADHLMPGELGMNFLSRVRYTFPHMQRILVTGYMKPDLLLRSVTEAALYRFMTKPVPISELVRIVEEAAQAHDASIASTR